MAESTSACQVRVRREAAKKRDEIYKQRDAEVRSISSDWKEGFAKLKGENDQRQKSLALFMKEQMAEINAWLLDALEGCQH